MCSDPSDFVIAESPCSFVPLSISLTEGGYDRGEEEVKIQLRILRYSEYFSIDVLRSLVWYGHSDPQCLVEPR